MSISEFIPSTETIIDQAVIQLRTSGKYTADPPEITIKKLGSTNVADMLQEISDPEVPGIFVGYLGGKGSRGSKQLLQSRRDLDLVVLCVALSTATFSGDANAARVLLDDAIELLDQHQYEGAVWYYAGDTTVPIRQNTAAIAVQFRVELS